MGTIKRILGKVRCWHGDHDVYSYASDADYDFHDLDLSQLSSDEVIAKFEEHTTLRCRRCNWTFPD